MKTFADFAPLYDFSQIELAVQSFFVATAPAIFVQPPNDGDPTRETWIPQAGTVAIFTAFQNQVFQKAQPRVTVSLSGISPVKLRLHTDSNDQLQYEWWKGRLTFQIITAANYLFHTQLRATVLSLGAHLAPCSGAGQQLPIGMNAYLNLHEVPWIEPTDVSTAIQIESGYYLSPVSYMIDFAVKPTSWP